MSVIHIDSNQDDNTVVLSGSIDQLIANRRAIRFLKDNTNYTITNDEIVISISDNLNKCIDRVKTAIKRAKCEVSFSETTNSDIQDYIIENNKFRDFSSKALSIRNNKCVSAEFEFFKDILVDHMPSRTLYSQQMLAAYHLAYSQNACNFSVPGAGKTSVVYGAYTFLKNLPDSDLKRVEKLLIIGPLNSFGPWELEYKECFGIKPIAKRLTSKMNIGDKKQYLYGNNTAEIILTSYASVASIIEELRFFLEKNKVMIVLDEAHKIKNTSGGIISQSILALAPSGVSRVVLTGTPAPNGYEDLYNLFKFIWPTRDIITHHIGQLKDMSKTPDDPRVNSLITSVLPYYIRIKKSDLGIPIATENPPVIVEMKPAQRKIYDYIEEKYIGDIAKSKDQHFKNELIKARLIRLMQAATNPALLVQPLLDFTEIEGVDLLNNQEDSTILNEILNYSNNEIPAKFEEAKKLIEDIIHKGEKVIVWACYINNINYLEEYLSANGIESKKLYGATPIATGEMSDEDDEYWLTREAIVKEFHKDDSSFRVIIANPFAVSESISLHKACHNAIYLERSFNAAHYIQSKDRIHRYGLKDNDITNYYYLLSDCSVDETIHKRLIEKEQMLLQIIESMPIPLFDNLSEDCGDNDIKAILKDYAKRIKKK